MQQFTPVGAQDKTLTSAAVVVAVSSHPDTGEACILLTRRSSKLRKHSGQFALPGGKVDGNETLIEAALRELSEELDLSASQNNVIGLLDDFSTESGFCITPVVIWIENHKKMKPNPDEVAAVYEIPMSELEQAALGANHEEGAQNIQPGAKSHAIHTDPVNSQSVMSLNLPSTGTTIYSPTAAIIFQFKEVAIFGRSTRVAHFRQPKFAWQ